MYGNQLTRLDDGDSIGASLSESELAAFQSEVSMITNEVRELLPSSYLIESSVTSNGPVEHQAVIYGETMLGIPFNVVIPVTVDRLETYTTGNETFFEDEDQSDIATQFAAKIVSADKQVEADFPAQAR